MKRTRLTFEKDMKSTRYLTDKYH